MHLVNYRLLPLSTRDRKEVKNNNMKTWIKLVLLSVAVFLVGCKTQNINFTVPERTLPERYLNSLDTTNLGQIKWREYFTDAYLVSLLDSALEHNIDRKIALERIELANSTLMAAKGALLPTVSANFAPAIRRFGHYTMDGVGNATTEMHPGRIVPVNLPDYYVGLQSSWEVDIWKKLSNRRKSAYANVLASAEGGNFVTTSVVTEVSAAYYELITLDNELDIIIETIRNQEEVLDVVRYQKEAGRANELVLQQFKAQQLHTKTLERETLQRILETENRLNFLLGRYPQPISRNKEELFKDLPLEIAAGVPSQMLLNRPDVRAANLQVQASKFDVKAANAEFLPSLTITAGVGFQAYDPSLLFKTPMSMAYSLVGGLVAPLLNKSAIKARFNTAKSNQIIAMYEYQKSIINGYTEVLNELNKINAIREISDLKTLQSNELEKAVETSNELYTSAKATYMEVLLAQQNALQAKLDMVESHRKQRMAMVNMYKALGGGWK